MIPAQREQLISQMHYTNDHIDYNRIDASNIDPKRYQDTTKTLQMMGGAQGKTISR